MKVRNFFFFFLIFISLHAFALAQSVKVMTLNIRYDEPRDSLDNWHLRKKEMVEFVKKQNPAIFGIQEGLYHQVKYLDSALTKHIHVGSGRDDGYKQGEFSALFIDTTMYKIVKSGTFWLSETPDKVSIGWDAALPRICTYAHIMHSQNKKSMWIFNTHFDHIGKIARSKSSEILLKKMMEFNPVNQASIIMGDFNATPDEEPIQYLTGHFGGAPKKIKGPFGTFNGFGREPNLRRIDYIFARGISSIKYRHILAKRNNNRYISDHLPVVAIARI